MEYEQDAKAEPEILQPNTLATLNRSEIDIQIATAHQYPRSISLFTKRGQDMVKMSPQVAEQCIYALKRKDKDGNAVVIDGPSARFAEIIRSNWGNCRVASRQVSDEGQFLVAQGVFHDLESNVGSSTEVRRRITTNKGKRYSEDMVATTSNAACSIAARNAVLQGIPKALWWPLYEAAKQAATGNAKSISEQRATCIAEFSKIHVSPDLLFESLGINGIEDISSEHIVLLRSMFRQIRDGDSTIEELFGSAEDNTIKELSASLGWNEGRLNMAKAQYKQSKHSLIEYMRETLAKAKPEGAAGEATQPTMETTTAEEKSTPSSNQTTQPVDEAAEEPKARRGRGNGQVDI